MMRPLPRTIRVQPDPFGALFDVEILPPLTDGPCHDQAFANVRSARGYASGLRMVLGFPVIDLCGGTDG